MHVSNSDVVIDNDVCLVRTPAISVDLPFCQNDDSASLK